MGAIQFVVSRWLFEAGAVITAVACLVAGGTAQVKIRDTIRIRPKPLPASRGEAAAGGGTLRLILTQSGTIDPRPTISNAVWMTNPCGEGGSAVITGGVTTVEVPAKAGGTMAAASFRVLQSPSMHLVYAFYLDDDLIDSLYLEPSCPVSCLFQGLIKVIPLYSSFEIGIGPQYGESSMFYGDSSGRIAFKYSAEACSPVVWSPGSRATIVLTEGAAVGTLVNAEGEDVGDEFSGTAVEIQQLRFVANGAASPGINRVVLQVSSRGIASSHTLEVFQPEPEVHHFALSAYPDTIHHGETSVLLVQARDEENRNVELSDGARLNLYVGAGSGQFGVLRAVFYGQEATGTSLSGIPYAAARVGGVVYIANGANPLGKGPQTVPVGVQWAENVQVGGFGKVVVRCRIDPPRYAQADSRWGNDWYDSSFAINKTSGQKDTVKVRDWGCALSALASTLTALGDTVNPGQLNRWMKSRSPGEGGFRGSSVNWDAVELHSTAGLHHRRSGGSLFAKDSTGGYSVNEQARTSETVLENSLSACMPVIAQVFNERTGNQHWVTVTERVGGRYKIVDPGSGKNYLDEYRNGDFWGYVTIMKD